MARPNKHNFWIFFAPNVIFQTTLELPKNVLGEMWEKIYRCLASALNVIKVIKYASIHIDCTTLTRQFSFY